MATTSITKEFIVKDAALYDTLKKAVTQIPAQEVKTTEPSNIEKGRELLKSFSFR